MQGASRLLALALVAAPLGAAGAARADAIRSYDRVVDMGKQANPANPYYTYYPRIDQSGKLVDSTNGYGDYRVDKILDSDPTKYPGHFLGTALYKGSDPTNLLPTALNGAGTTVQSPNISGHVVGILAGTGGAFFFAPGSTQPTWLKSLPGETQPVGAYALNDRDQIVGQQDGKAIFYASPTSEPVELSKLLTTTSGWRFDQATGINNQGQIVGYGVNPHGMEADFLLNPSSVPEPGTLAVFALAGLALAARSVVHRVRVVRF